MIECSGLTKNYGGLRAVNNLSFEIEGRKITGLIGRNGAGKTTLLKLIAGYFRPNSGSVRVFGQNPFNSLAVSSGMIFADDDMTFPDCFTLNDILESAASFYPRFDTALARRLLGYFSIDPKKKHRSLSKGMRSTFNVSLALSTHCSLTIFDEPTTGMDAAVRRDFYRAMLKDYLEYPRTVIISSHLLNEFDDILEDILLIRNGEKCVHMPISEFSLYAVGLKGDRAALEKFLSGREMIYREDYPNGSAYAVLRNDFDGAQFDRLRAAGIEACSVDPNDLSIYLTSEGKGEIDDVFAKR